jgi:membrane protease YdiL (CAAX protease family)
MLPAGRLSPHLRGHFLLFDRKSVPPIDSAAFTRLLLIYLFLEVVIGPRLWILTWLHLPLPPSWVRVPFLVALALVAVRYLARLKLSQIGLYRWREWTTTERSYFLQTVCLGNVVFITIFAHRLALITVDQSLWGRAFLVVLTQFAWGFYQELVYRGILQTALVGRLGPVAGILIANTLFTFGPLHFYHFAGRTPLPMFIGIFAIGLFFSVLFRRSGNLWIVGALHGIGDAYIDGLRLIVR